MSFQLTIKVEHRVKLTRANGNWIIHFHWHDFFAYKRPWQCLYFLPEPHGQGSLRPTLRSPVAT
ncbi:hypothetical protein Xentx_01064 [Xenorhabdus thuongxuanensis]|uniref:Uncharacterized protein n=1 Tax=Xenorhabdus thuongxuanensis TaxID=1873484 RepID=A0A1Q5U6A8_9GAMM|nr:hypothetical protein Xentx_01064 [Xenorhabdus thuongxuanensis]